MQPPELETLDQLLGGDLPLGIIRGLFGDDRRFVHAIEAMLCDGEVQLLTAEGDAVPKWQWRDVLDAAPVRSKKSGHMLSITDKGARRIG
jgi:hypothetical protein